jgi:hypothetical protein
MLITLEGAHQLGLRMMRLIYSTEPGRNIQWQSHSTKTEYWRSCWAVAITVGIKFALDSTELVLSTCKLL